MCLRRAIETSKRSESQRDDVMREHGSSCSLFWMEHPEGKAGSRIRLFFGGTTAVGHSNRVGAPACKKRSEKPAHSREPKSVTAPASVRDSGRAENGRYDGS